MSPNCTMLIFNWQHFTLIFSFNPNSFSFSFLYKQIFLPHLILEVTWWFDEWFVIRTLLLTWKRIKSSNLRIFTQMNTNRSISLYGWVDKLICFNWRWFFGGRSRLDHIRGQIIYIIDNSYAWHLNWERFKFKLRLIS